MAEPQHSMTTGPMRWAMLALAIVSLALGIVGLFLPVLPTVPFVLLAAWAAARSSPRMHAWLENHPNFGHHLRNWRDGGVVPRSAKVMATVFMGGSIAMLLFVLPHKWMAAAVAAVMVAVLVWLWRRPEQRPS